MNKCISRFSYNIFIRKGCLKKESLQKLKDMGKKLFVATNSHAEYAELTMTQSIGEDWKSKFT